MTPSQKATLAPFTVDELIAELRARTDDTVVVRNMLEWLEREVHISLCGGRTGIITKNGGSHVTSDAKATRTA